MATTSLRTKAQQNGHSSTTLPMSNPSSEQDEFDTAAFADSRTSLPYLQLLNCQDPNQAGFFITAANAEAVHFTPTEEWTEHSITFQNGTTASGYRSLVARFLILHQSQLLLFERDSGSWLGQYRKARYDRNTMIIKRRYLVYVISKDKHLLHQSPLLLTAKGAFCGTFGEAVEQFRQDMSKAYSAATGAKQPRGERFMALSILAVRVQPELKGQTKKSWVCSVAEYGVPTVENWKSFFVGYKAELKERILAEVDQWAEFGNSARELEAQAEWQLSSPQSKTETTQQSSEELDEFDYGYPEEI
jgi:hypothetical protein